MSMFDTLAPASPFADVNDFGGVDFEAMNKGVTPIFYVEPVQDMAATEKAGALRMQEMEMVRIVVAGDNLSVAAAPVDAGVKARFADQYERWCRNRQDNHIDGTPLRHWPLLSPAQVIELKALNIESVEQLAGVADTFITKINDGRVWRAKALAWLQSAQDNGAAARFAAENERLRNELERQSETVQALSDRLAQLEQEAAPRAGEVDLPVRRGPGRPRAAA